MEKSVDEQLLDILEELGEEKLKAFHRCLQDPQVLGGFPAIKQSQLETADELETVDLMVETYTDDVMKVTNLILKKIRETGTTTSPTVIKYSSASLYKTFFFVTFVPHY